MTLNLRADFASTAPLLYRLATRWNEREKKMSLHIAHIDDGSINTRYCAINRLLGVIVPTVRRHGSVSVSVSVSVARSLFQTTTSSKLDGNRIGIVLAAVSSPSLPSLRARVITPATEGVAQSFFKGRRAIYNTRLYSYTVYTLDTQSRHLSPELRIALRSTCARPPLSMPKDSDHLPNPSGMRCAVSTFEDTFLPRQRTVARRWDLNCFFPLAARQSLRRRASSSKELALSNLV